MEWEGEGCKYEGKKWLFKFIDFIDHNNINIERDLDKGGLHLNRGGTDTFFTNLLETVTCWREQTYNGGFFTWGLFSDYSN